MIFLRIIRPFPITTPGSQRTCMNDSRKEQGPGEKGTSPKERKREMKKLQFSATSVECLWRDTKETEALLTSCRA